MRDHPRPGARGRAGVGARAGAGNRGKGVVFAAGLEWAIENGASVVNLSLSSKSDALYGLFHELADEAYFANVLLVSAANNLPGPSYPSLFASVVSVAAHDVAGPWAFFYNPRPPVEFGAYGLDVPVAWNHGGPAWRPATASRPPTSRGSPPSSARSTPGRRRSR